MRIFIFHHYFVYLHQKIRQGSLPDGKDMEVNKHKDSLICIQAKSVMLEVPIRELGITLLFYKNEDDK